MDGSKKLVSCLVFIDIILCVSVIIDGVIKYSCEMLQPNFLIVGRRSTVWSMHFCCCNNL